MKKNIKLGLIFSIYILLITSIFNLTSIKTKKEVNTPVSIIDPPTEIINPNQYKEIIDNYIEKYKNNEVVGEITILNTEYKKAIMQHNDNDYYLNHLENKKSHYLGSIYLDFRNNISKDHKLLIYGHNSSNVTMPFKILENYYHESYYKNHEYIEILTNEKKRLYKIFSVYVETNDFDYMKIDFSSKEEWLSHINKLKNKSLYDTNTTLSANDNILILQTCSTHKNYRKYKNKYLLIVAKEVL